MKQTGEYSSVCFFVKKIYILYIFMENKKTVVYKKIKCYDIVVEYNNINTFKEYFYL